MTPSFSTPGVHVRPARRVRPVGPLVRSDVTAFLGYARRGPAYRPVRVEAWREFLDLFGEPREVGYLAPAVRAFFENGGSTCWVVRVVDETATAASWTSEPATVGGVEARWRIEASFNAGRLEEPEGSGVGAGPEARAPSGGSAGHRLPDPGATGNQLSVVLQRDVSFRTRTLPGILEEGFVTEAEGMGGLERRSVVRLHQEAEGSAAAVDAVVGVVEVDHARRRIVWEASLRDAGFDLLRPIRLESVEVGLRVLLGGRVVETFRRLGVHPEHHRAFMRVVPGESRWIDVTLATDPGTEPSELPWTDPALWPPETRVELTGGIDGLTGVRAEDYERALDEVGRIDEVALLAAPDLVLRASAAPPPPPPRPATVDCHSLEPPPSGKVRGRVVTRLEADRPQVPVAGATVVDTASGARGRSDDSGEFRLDGVGPSLVTLRVEKAGFETVEVPTQPHDVLPPDPVEIFLTPLLLPRALGEDEVLRVQQAMADQGRKGLYRFALLDPPSRDMDTQEIASWRARLGDTSHAALYYPWLAARTGSLALPATAADAGPGLVWLPPSGHVAGATAAVDRKEGVHHASANRPLRLVEDVALEVDDARQGVLNPVGVNCIRAFPGRGVRIFGGRTLSSDPEWRYVSVRRLMLVLEETLEKSMQWAVFEPNDTFRRQALRMSIIGLLERLRRRGALAGESPEAAYRVKCDEDNNPPERRAAGELLAEVAVAPAVPFEFVTFRLGRTADAIEVTE